MIEIKQQNLKFFNILCGAGYRFHERLVLFKFYNKNYFSKRFYDILIVQKAK